MIIQMVPSPSLMRSNQTKKMKKEETVRERVRPFVKAALAINPPRFYYRVLVKM